MLTAQNRLQWFYARLRHAGRRREIGGMGGKHGDRPTLKTISKLSGLAVPTISRALNDAPDISSETKARVRKLAQEVGYVPDRAGLRLKTGKTHFVAFMLGLDQVVQDHTGPVIASLMSALSSTSYNLLVLPQDNSKDPVEEIQKVISARLADAIILNRTLPEDERVKFLMEQNQPFVTYGRTNWHARHAYYDFDNQRFAELGVVKLAEMGRRNLVLLAPPRQHMFARDMIEGARQQAERLGLNIIVLESVTTDDAPEFIVPQISQLLREKPGTDGFLCSSANKASAIVAGAQAAERAIGVDYDLCVKDVTPSISFGTPEIHHVYEDLSVAGQFLAKAALHAIENPKAPPLQQLTQLPLPALDETAREPSKR